MLLSIVVVDALLLIPFYGSGKVAFLFHFGFIPAHPSLLTLFSAMFLHAGILHFAGNMWFFWIFGRKIESTFGHFQFAALYLFCGVGGQLLYLLLSRHSFMPLVGASGAISGIAGTYFILFPRDRFNLHIYLGWWRVAKIDTTTRSAVGAWIGEQFVLGLISGIAAFSSVAFWAHIGGFAFGAAAGALYNIYKPVALRPEIPIFELEGEDTIEQPSSLVTLKLN